MMRIKKRILSIITVLITVLVMNFTAAAAMAANGDFHDKVTGKTYPASQYRANPSLFNELLTALGERGSDFVYERAGKGYNYQKLLDELTSKMSAGEDLATAFAEALADTSIQESIPTSLQITAVSAYNPILQCVTVTVNDSSLVKAAYDGTTALAKPTILDATHVTVFCDKAPSALALAGSDGVKVYPPSTGDTFEVIGIE